MRLYWYVLALSLSLLFVYWPLVVGDWRVKWDAYDYAFPQIVYLKQSIANGVFPLWNPFVLSGEAFFAQPATSVYNPLFLGLALWPFGDTYRVFEILLLSLPLVFAFGARCLLQRWLASLSVVPVVLDAASNSLAIVSFGSLLGQPAVAMGMAVFPWVVLASERLIEANQKRDRLKRSVELGLLGALTLLVSYFGLILYMASVCSVVLVIRRGWGRIIDFCLAAFVAVCGAAHYLIPAIENRQYWYRTIADSFISPDLRLRGLSLSKEQVVDIVKNEQHLLSILSGVLAIEPGRAHWVMGIGWVWLAAALSSLYFLRSISVTRWLWLGVVLSASYAMGPRSAVFDLVFEWIPLFNNIRYPVFSFFILQFLLVMLGAVAISRLGTRLGIRKQVSQQSHRFARIFRKQNAIAALAMILVLDAVIFFKNEGLFSGNAADILVKRENLQAGLAAIGEKPVIENPKRRVSQSKSFEFEDKSWLGFAQLISHGYSTSDSPVYWALKSWNGLESMVWPIERVKEYSEQLTRGLDQKSLAEITSSVKGLKEGEVFGSTSWTKEPSAECKVGSVLVSPNEISFPIQVRGECLFFVGNKFYPGWHLIDEAGVGATLETAQWVFPMVRVRSGESELNERSTVIRLVFQPLSFQLGLVVAMTTWLLSAAIWFAVRCRELVRKNWPCGF